MSPEQPSLFPRCLGTPTLRLRGGQSTRKIFVRPGPGIMGATCTCESYRTVAHCPHTWLMSMFFAMLRRLGYPFSAICAISLLVDQS